MIKNTILAEFIPVEDRVKLEVPYDKLGQTIERRAQRWEQFGVGAIEAYLPLLAVGDKLANKQAWLESPLAMFVASGLVADGICRTLTGNGLVAELEYLAKRGKEYFKNYYNPNPQ